MKRFLIQLFAGLASDESPLPDFIKRTISRIPSVARQLGACDAVARRLSLDAEQWIRSDKQILQETQCDHQPTNPSFNNLLLATAAVVCVSVGIIYAFQRDGAAQQQTAQQQTPGASESIDFRPLLASLKAGQQVSDRIAAGILEVGQGISETGNKLGTKVKVDSFIPLSKWLGSSGDAESQRGTSQKRESLLDEVKSVSAREPKR